MKCPKCKEEIDYLENWCEVSKLFEMTVDKNGDACYVRRNGRDVSGGENVYACPKCNETLFQTESEAVKFLTVKEEENAEKD